MSDHADTIRPEAVHAPPWAVRDDDGRAYIVGPKSGPGWYDSVADDVSSHETAEWIVKCVNERNALLAERREAIDELEKLRDRAVCSGCGQDVDEGGNCDTEGCDDGEMIPASDLPGAMLANCERIAEDRAEWRMDWEALRAEAKSLEVGRREAIDALRDETLMLEQTHKTLRDLRQNWREISELREPDGSEGVNCLDAYLESLVADTDPSDARAALVKLGEQQQQ